MKKSLSISLFIFFVLATNIFSQHKMMYKAKGPTSFLYEIKAIIEEEDGKLLIKMMPDKSMMNDEEKKIDLAIDDEILFVNGKKVKNVDEFNKAYQAVKIGDSFELGAARDDNKFIVALKKVDPSTLNIKMKKRDANSEDNN
ncbi:MAG: hypothetical protein F9K45_04715 [Melioribacteraceae bacterium]|nr:MAG: hypothetical protein F9K45_04715 [Melioribacteraceae bacterium]